MSKRLTAQEPEQPGDAAGAQSFGDVFATHGEAAIPRSSKGGKVPSGSITVTTIASVANSTMAINPKLKSEDRTRPSGTALYGDGFS